MRVSRILSLYVLREIAQYLAIGLVAVVTILVTQNLLQRIDELAAVGFAASDALTVLRCLLGMLIAYAVPVAFLFGVLVCMARLSTDSEVTAMRSLGLGVAALLLPAMVLATVVSAATGFLMIQVEPDSRRALRAVLSSIASRGGIIEPGRFNDVGDRIIYVRERAADETLLGVIIFDSTEDEQPFTIFAEAGTFEFDYEASNIHIRLANGEIHFEPQSPGEEDYRRITFEKLDYAFDASPFLADDPSRIRPPDMTLTEIRGVLEYFDANDGRPPGHVRVKTRERYEIEMHRRLALPFGPLIFGLVGVPLGLRRGRGARSFGAFVCVLIAFAYYSVLSFGVYLGEAHIVPPIVALWLPNVLFASAALFLLRRANRAEL